MKSQMAILPLVDLVFLALGGMLACMTQMEIVNALPVEVARVGKGSAVIQSDNFMVLTLTADGMSLDGELVTEGELASRVASEKVILRVHKELPTQDTVNVIARLAEAGAEVSIEVKETSEQDTQ